MSRNPKTIPPRLWFPDNYVAVGSDTIISRNYSLVISHYAANLIRIVRAHERTVARIVLTRLNSRTLISYLFTILTSPREQPCFQPCAKYRILAMCMEYQSYFQIFCLSRQILVRFFLSRILPMSACCLISL